MTGASNRGPTGKLTPMRFSSTLECSSVPHIFSVPQFFYVSALRPQPAAVAAQEGVEAQGPLTFFNSRSTP
jgi:hypothetical protein